MANQNVVKPEEEALGSAINSTELFFEKNGKKVSYALIALLVIAAAVFGYKMLIVNPRAEKAAEMIVEAQYRFEAEGADYKLALEGDANGVGFLDVIEKYGSTSAGNLAKHYAGICYLRMGDVENAAKYLAKFSPVKGIPGAVINAQNLGLQGDIAVDKQEYAAAVKLFDKAVKAADNDFTAPMYLRKAALALMAAGDNAKAKEYFERIIAEYPASMDAREAEKYLGTIN